MDTNEVFNAGGIRIANPNYSKSKKNNQPQFITVADLNTPVDTSDPLSDTFYQADKQGDMTASQNYKDVEKYLNYGINPYKGEDNIDSQLEDAQSNWKKAVNAFGQAIVSQAVLGTTIAISDIVDAVSSKIFDVGDDDYQSDLSNYLTELRDKFNNDIAPIYVDPKKNIDNGGLLDMSWWLKGIPDIASTISLLIPSKLLIGGIKGLATISKLGRVGNKLKKFALSVDNIENAGYINKLKVSLNNPLTQEGIKYGADLAANSLLMRTMENYQEARDVNITTYDKAFETFSALSDEKYKEWLNKNESLLSPDLKSKDRESVAKDIAKQAADRTFTMDFTNLVFDVIQLYGLRNVGKGIKQLSAKGGGSSVQNAARQAKADALAFAEGKPHAPIELSKKDLYKQKLKDFANSGLPFILEESTEGIEEGVNYIAQQEGITYGKLLAEGTAKDYKADMFNPFGLGSVINTWRNLQNPINDYLKNAELHESAFWGFFGGLAFGGIHSTTNKVQLYFDRKAELERIKEKGLTTDGSKEGQPSMMDLLLSPEEYAANKAISMQQANLEAFANDLKRIDEGIDIYSEADEQGVHKKFTGDAETIKLKQDLAKAERQAEYISDLTTNAINSGTFNILKDYFTSDEMKKVFVQLGVISEDEVNNHVANVSTLMDKYKKMYNEQIAQVNSQVTAINAENKFEDNIPIEYVRIIAKQNYDKALKAEHINAKINALNADISELEQTKAIVNSGINTIEAKEAVKLTTLINLYGQYQAQKASLEQNKDMDILMKTRMLEDIERQKNDIIKELKGTTLTIGDAQINAGIAAVYQAFKIGNKFKQDKGVFTIDKDLYKKTDEEIINDVNALFDENQKLDNDVVLNQAKQLEKQLKSIINSDGTDRLNQVSSDLSNKYQALALYTVQQHIVESNIATTKKQILDEVDFIHNRYSEMRQKAIEKARDIVTELYTKYNGVSDTNQHIENAIIEMYKNNKQAAKNYALEIMSKEDADNFISALDVFSFSSKTADAMYDNLNIILATLKNYNEVKNGTINNETNNTASSETSDTSSSTTEQETTDSNQAISDTQNQQVNNISAVLDELNRGSQNAQNGTTSDQQAPSQDDREQQIKLKININSNGEIVSIKPSKAKKDTINAFINQNGDYELDVKSLPRNKQLKLIKAGIFTADGIDVLDQNKSWVVEENPTITKVGNDYKIATPGSIKEVDNAQGATEEEGQQVNPTTPVEDVNPVKPNTPVDETQATTDTTDNTQVQQQPAPASSFTGVVEQANDAPAVINNSIDNDTVFKINEGLTFLFGEALGDIENPQMSFDDVANQVFNEAKEQLKGKNLNISDDELKELVDQKKQEFIELNAELKAADNNEVDKAAANLAFLAKAEEYNVSMKKTYSDIFVNAINKFIDIYKDNVILPVINGKQLIRIKDLLYICDNCLGKGDGKLAAQIYNVVVAYLQTDEAKINYIVEDINEAESVLNHLYSEDRIEDSNKLSDLAAERVNIASFIANYEFNNNQRALDVYNNLKQGDELDIKLEEHDKHVQYVLYKDGVAVGSLPVPAMNPNTGAFHQVNNGWVVNITKQGTQIISDLKNVFTDIFTAVGPEYESLRSMIAQYQIADSDRHGETNDKLTKQFAENSVISTLVAYSKEHLKDNTNVIFVDEKTHEVDYQRLLDHLARVWRYTNKTANTSNATVNKNNIISNIDGWFEGLYNTYSRLNQLRDFNESDNFKVKVASITEGQIIQATNKNVLEEGYDELSYSSEAFTENLDVSLGVVMNQKLFLSGKEAIDIAFNTGSVLTGVFSRNEHPSYVKAVGVKCADDKKPETKVLADIKATLRSEIMTTVQKALNEENPDEIINLIKNILVCDYKDTSRIPLFKLMKGKPIVERAKNGNGVHISIPRTDEPNSFSNIVIYTKSIYKNNPAGNIDFYITRNNNVDEKSIKKSRVTLENEQSNNVKLFTDMIFEVLNKYSHFNVMYQGIEADNTKREDLTGFLKYVDGKFKVDIIGNDSASFHQEWNSYNDFIIKNNLVKVNTKIEKNSNFVRRGNKQVFNQTLFVTLPIADIKIDNKAVEYIQSNSDKTLFEEAKQIIDKDDENAGKSLFELAFGTEALDRFNSAAIELDILDDVLPSRLAYDSSINYYMSDDNFKGAYAYTRGGKHSRTKYVYYNSKGEAKQKTIPSERPIIVGSALLNMLTSSRPANRALAIRKLIHEQIHYKLADNPNKHYILRSLQDIYNEFNDNLKKQLKEQIGDYYANKEKVNANWGSYNTQQKVLVSIFRAIEGYKGDRLYEEFLAESLTNQNFIDFLNSIKVEGEKEKGSDNLFTKIFKLICKLFNIEVKDDSLLMKELNTLRDIMTVEVNDIPVDISESNEEEANPPVNPETDSNVDNPKNDDNQNNDNQSENSDEPTDENQNKDNTPTDNYDDLWDDNEGFDEGPAARAEEYISLNDGFDDIVGVPDGFNRVVNLDTEVQNLPSELRKKYLDFARNGFIEFKCGR